MCGSSRHPAQNTIGITKSTNVLVICVMVSLVVLTGIPSKPFSIGVPCELRLLQSANNSRAGCEIALGFIGRWTCVVVYEC